MRREAEERRKKWGEMDENGEIDVSRLQTGKVGTLW